MHIALENCHQFLIIFEFLKIILKFKNKQDHMEYQRVPEGETQKYDSNDIWSAKIGQLAKPKKSIEFGQCRHMWSSLTQALC